MMPPLRRHAADPQYLSAGIRRQRVAIVEALGHVATRFAQELALARGLHPLRHHLDAELVAHGDHRVDDGRLAGVVGYTGHETLVHLDGADRETAERSEEHTSE